jgi:penicillin-binding protein 1C
MSGRGFRILCAGLFSALIAANAIGFGLSEVVRRLGPPPLGAMLTHSVLVVDRDGRLLRPFTTADGFWRLPAAPAEVDPRFLAMLIAYEDKRFHEHHGVDPWALVRALGQAVRSGHIVSGGSTLTMQVARLLEPRPQRTLGAKLAEMIRAVEIESRLSKDEILRLYLALAPYGGNLEGVRAASLAYFGKEPKRLSVAEAALLVALPQSPEARRPDRDRVAAIKARRRVLDRMVGAGAMSKDQAELALEEEVPAGRRPFPMLAAHLAERLARGAPDSAVIRTTISRPLQEALEGLARDRAAALGGGTSVAILVADNATGEVRAHVGGVGLLDERAGAVDLTQTLRSPGSTLKPFVYGLAFEDGLAHPETLVDDRPTRFGSYRPENFDDAFQGTVTMRRALQQSLNVPAVLLLKAIGPNRLVARMRNAGAGPVLPPEAVPGLAVGLGGAGVRLTDLTTLYLALARGGEAVPLTWQTRGEAAGRRLFEPAAAWQVADILLGSPPPENAAGGRIAFKTGTSYGYRDAWSLGFDGATTIGVWAGRPDGAALPGLVGRLSAAPILFEAFQRIGENRVPLARAPSGVLLARTGELPPALQRFRPDGLPETAASGPGDAPLIISFPPNGARVDLSAGGEGAGLALKAMGGAPPFTWLADGVPIVVGEQRRQAVWQDPARGFARLSVVDAKGATATARVRLD